MKWFQVAACILITCNFNTVASAAYKDGYELLTMCEKEDNEQMYCLGYIAGAVDAIGTMNEVMDILKRQMVFCVPDGVSLGQLRLTVIQQAKNHPEILNQDASVLVIMAVKQAFPTDC